MRLFADDCLLYREVNSINDQVALQADLNTLVEWAHTWGMAFNIKKCNMLTVTNRKKKNLTFTYKMDGKKVLGIRDSKYLGVTFTHNLSWNQHIAYISGAANRMLGFLWRNLQSCPRALKEQAYKTYVRPKLEYCCTIWGPYQQESIKKLEMVQHRAARFVTNTPHRRTEENQISITGMIQELGWQPSRKGDATTDLSYFTRSNRVSLKCLLPTILN